MKLSTRFWLAVAILAYAWSMWYMITTWTVEDPNVLPTALAIMISVTGSVVGVVFIVAVLATVIPEFNNWLDKQDK